MKEPTVIELPGRLSPRCLAEGTPSQAPAPASSPEVTGNRTITRPDMELLPECEARLLRRPGGAQSSARPGSGGEGVTDTDTQE